MNIGSAMKRRHRRPVGERQRTVRRVPNRWWVLGCAGVVAASLPLLMWVVSVHTGLAAFAAIWTADGVAVCVADKTQQSVQLTGDGAGGAVVVWPDDRDNQSDLYAQRLDSGGTPQWTANGVAICPAGKDQHAQQIVSVGSGQTIVVWHDARNGSIHKDIYAQRLDGAGAVQWTAEGVGVCTEAGQQQRPAMAPDGSGGVIIAWSDGRYGWSSRDIYAQRLDSGGTPQWTANGSPVCTADDAQDYARMLSDGSGAALVIWHDNRSGNLDIYAQSLDADGVPQWASNGVAVSTADYGQQEPKMVTDGSGGAIIVWEDSRTYSYADIYAQRLDNGGNVKWTADGVAVSALDSGEVRPQLVSDGSGGAIIVWQDYRAGNYDIYAQRLDGSGAAQWGVNGVAVSTAGNHQIYPQLSSDGAGGAVIVWEDARSDSGDIYAQWLNSTGSAQWASNGVPVSEAIGGIGGQTAPRISSDGLGGAIVAWTDGRGSSFDIYAQRLIEAIDQYLPVVIRYE